MVEVLLLGKLDIELLVNFGVVAFVVLLPASLLAQRFVQMVDLHLEGVVFLLQQLLRLEVVRLLRLQVQDSRSLALQIKLSLRLRKQLQRLCGHGLVPPGGKHLGFLE
jgi:hypothetical protein